jgi:hypothetical protein
MNSLGIRLLLPLAVLATSIGGSGAQPGKTPQAKVTVSGKQVVTFTLDGDKKDRYVVIEEDSRTSIRVGTDQDVRKIAEEVLGEHSKLIKAYQAMVQKLVEKKDLEGIKKADKNFKAASEELLKHIDYVTAVGTVSMQDDDVRVDGKLRPYDFKGVDKDLGKGKALVEGEATQIKYDAGQGEKMVLAIQNGAKAIVVVGNAAENQVYAKGTIRVLGVLRAGKNGHPVLEAEKVEAVKK